ncbi:MAG: InlB B-repeat-containing protein [Hydrogeniiclostridium mannosilyticum]
MKENDNRHEQAIPGKNPNALYDRVHGSASGVCRLADTDTAPATGTGISWSVESDGTYKVNDDVTVSGTYTVGNDANGTYVIALDTDTGNTETYSLTMDTIVVASDSKLTVKGGAKRHTLPATTLPSRSAASWCSTSRRRHLWFSPFLVKSRTRPRPQLLQRQVRRGRPLLLPVSSTLENGVTVKDGATVIIKSDEHSIGTIISGTITVEEGAVLKIQSDVTLNSDIIAKGTVEVENNATVSGTGNIVLEGGTASGNVDAYYKITQDAVSGGNVDLTYKVGNDTYSIRGDVIPVGSTVVVTATPQSDYKVSSGTYTIGDDATKFSIENFSSSTAGQKVIGEFTPNNGPIKVAVTFAYVSSGGGDHGGGGGGGGGGGSSSSSSRVTVASTTHGRVTVSPDNPKTGDTVTITVRPDDGYVLDTLTVTNTSGKEVELTKVNDTRYPS